ncbi:MAG TPA: hypothetical protein VGU66_11715 [Candidatus Elarobacter sp.]|nr:hypothetical protein [Candidatus Elarobacter sp.]
MRTLTASLALVFVACSFGQASAATAGFSDTICPEATQYVLGVGKLKKDDPPQRIYDAAQAAVDAYQRCSKDKLSNGFREAQHYADTRGAGLAVVAARALVALNRPDDARRELLQWRPLAQQVVDWQSETQTTSQAHSASQTSDGSPQTGPGIATGVTGSDHRPSMYRAAAKEIVVAIDEELGKIGDLHPPPPKP